MMFLSSKTVQKEIGLTSDHLLAVVVEYNGTCPNAKVDNFLRFLVQLLFHARLAVLGQRAGAENYSHDYHKRWLWTIVNKSSHIIIIDQFSICGSSIHRVFMLSGLPLLFLDFVHPHSLLFR